MRQKSVVKKKEKRKRKRKDASLKRNR